MKFFFLAVGFKHGKGFFISNSYESIFSNKNADFSTNYAKFSYFSVDNQ